MPVLPVQLCDPDAAQPPEVGFSRTVEREEEGTILRGADTKVGHDC